MEQEVNVAPQYSRSDEIKRALYNSFPKEETAAPLKQR